MKKRPGLAHLVKLVNSSYFLLRKQVKVFLAKVTPRHWTPLLVIPCRGIRNRKELAKGKQYKKSFR